MGTATLKGPNMAESQGKHTPGPWEAICTEPSRGDPFGDAMVRTGNGTMSICCHKSGRTLGEDRANARRIVACVNACEGINPDSVQDLLKACEAIVSHDKMGRFGSPDFPAVSVNSQTAEYSPRSQPTAHTGLATISPNRDSEYVDTTIVTLLSCDVGDGADGSPEGQELEMATMMKPSTSLRELCRMVREDMRAERENGVAARPTYVLRADGNTDVYRMVGRRVVRTRVAGHVTLGMSVVPSDLPCVVSGGAK